VGRGLKKWGSGLEEIGGERKVEKVGKWFEGWRGVRVGSGGRRVGESCECGELVCGEGWMEMAEIEDVRL
jgi:hypothetical protein